MSGFRRNEINIVDDSHILSSSSDDNISDPDQLSPVELVEEVKKLDDFDIVPLENRVYPIINLPEANNNDSSPKLIKKVSVEEAWDQNMKSSIKVSALSDLE